MHREQAQFVGHVRIAQVRINDERPVPGACERIGDIDRRMRLTDAALIGNDTEAAPEPPGLHGLLHLLAQFLARLFRFLDLPFRFSVSAGDRLQELRPRRHCDQDPLAGHPGNIINRLPVRGVRHRHQQAVILEMYRQAHVLSREGQGYLHQVFGGRFHAARIDGPDFGQMAQHAAELAFRADAHLDQRLVELDFTVPLPPLCLNDLVRIEEAILEEELGKRRAPVRFSEIACWLSRGRHTLHRRHRKEGERVHPARQVPENKRVRAPNPRTALAAKSRSSPQELNSFSMIVQYA